MTGDSTSFSSNVLVIRIGTGPTSTLVEDLCREGFSPWVFEHPQNIESVLAFRNWSIVLIDASCADPRSLLHAARIRKIFSGPLALMLRQGDEKDHLQFLELGLDEVLLEPISRSLLAARLQTLQRRINQDAPANPRNFPLRAGELLIDPARREVRRAGRVVKLTNLEFDLLNLLARKPGVPISRDALYIALRGIPYDGLDRSVDLHVSRLRRKLAPTGGESDLILTIRGVGYQLAPPPI